jgi:hypothetical protein
MIELPAYVTNKWYRKELDENFPDGWMDIEFDRSLETFKCQIPKLSDYQLAATMEWAQKAYVYYHCELSDVFYACVAESCRRLRSNGA